MNRNFIKYLLLTSILTSQFIPTKAITSTDVSFAAFGGIVLGALLCIPTHYLTKKNQKATYQKKLHQKDTKHKNESEDLEIQITILKARLATKEETLIKQTNNKEENKNSGFFGKLSAIKKIN